MTIADKVDYNKTLAVENDKTVDVIFNTKNASVNGEKAKYDQGLSLKSIEAPKFN